jgi:hypothetical protein
MSAQIPVTKAEPKVKKPKLILPAETAKQIVAMASSLPEDPDEWSGQDDLVNDELVELMDNFYHGRTRREFRNQLLAVGATQELIDNFFST